MSETAAAPSAPEAASAPEVDTNAQTQTAQAKAATGKEQAQPQAAEELEEIKIGSTTGRVPKELAKTIKNLERGFHSKAQEVAQIKNYFGGLAQQAKENPLVAEQIFEQLGIDADQFSQARLAKRLEREMMSPEQRELMELKAWKAEQERAAQEAKQREEKDKLTKAEQETGMALRKELMSTVEPYQLIRDDAHMIARVAATMAASEEQGLGWTWKQCADRVDKEIRDSLKSIAKRLDPQGIQELLGDEPLTKWREYDVKRVTDKAAPSASATKGPGSKSVSQAAGKKALTEAEYRDYFAKLARG